MHRLPRRGRAAARPLIALVVGSAWLAASLAPSSADAAPGDIAFDSCVVATNTSTQAPTGTVCDDVSGTGPGQFESLSQPTDIATASNGHAYASSVFVPTISNLAPDDTTGNVELLGCVEGSAGSNPGNCTDLGTTNTVLSSPEAIATIDDDVYVADFSTNAVLHLKIGAGGGLSLEGCVASNSTLASDCTDISATTNALEGAGSISAAPDGGNVYVGSFNQQAVVNLSRAADGSLSFTDCLTENAPTTTGCTDVGTAPLRPIGIAANADFVALVANEGEAITQLSRGAGGTLAFQTCVKNAPTAAPCTGAVGTDAISSPQRVAVTAAGTVYATASDTDALVQLAPDGNGDLEFVACLTTDPATTGCTDISATTNVLDRVDRLALGPLEETLVAAGRQRTFPPAVPTRGIANFDLSPSGTISFSDCVTSSATTTGCSEDISATTNVLTDNAGLAVSADGASVYGVGDNPDSAYRLSREPKVPNTTITSGPSGTTTDPTPTFSFVSDEPGSTFSCKVDDGPFVACSSPRTLAALAVGAHTFSVFATDSDGQDDPTPASRNFTVAVPTPPPIPLPDITVDGSAKAKKTQRQRGRRIAVKARATAGEPLRATAKGKVKIGKRSYRLKRKDKQLSAGQTKNLKLKPKKVKAAKKIRRALKRGRKPRAKLTVKLTDEAGNSESTRLKVKLKR